MRAVHHALMHAHVFSDTYLQLHHSRYSVLNLITGETPRPYQRWSACRWLSPTIVRGMRPPQNNRSRRFTAASAACCAILMLLVEAPGCKGAQNVVPLAVWRQNLICAAYRHCRSSDSGSDDSIKEQVRD
jgi:hypothetical protein